MDEGGSSRHGQRPETGSGGGEADLISALPEDLLLQVLGRLRYTAAAARTSLLSRRWRGLWTHLPDLTFRDVAPGPLRSALASLRAAVVGVGVPFLDICVLFPSQKIVFDDPVSSLLDDAARLSPVELRFAVRPDFGRRNYFEVKVPHFHRATTIQLEGLYFVSSDPRGSFPVVESLSLTECCVDLADLVLRCPRLRVLRLANCRCPRYGSIIIRSASLQEIDVQSWVRSIHQIVIETPLLKKLSMSLCTSYGVMARVSVLAPMLEKVWWWCRYSTITAGLGPWGLQLVRLRAAERNGRQGQVASSVHLPRAHVLSLYAGAHCSFSFPTETNIEANAGLSFAAEIEKHMVTDFSVLELFLERRGHFFGAFVSRVLGMHRICTATQSLKIVLQKSKDKEACLLHCPCDEPSNWTGHTISLANLENVEIKGFEGEDHGFDFLKLIFRCAPMLKRITVRLSDEVTTSNDWCTKIYDIFKAYPFVECNLGLSSAGSTRSSHSGAAT